MDQQREPRRALDERPDGRAFQPDHEVTFPMAWHGTVVGLCGAFADHHLLVDVRPGLALCP